MGETKLDIQLDDKRDDKTRELNVEERAGIINHLFFWFVNPLVTYGYRRPLTAADLWPIAEQDKCTTAGKRLNDLWEREKAKKGAKASLFSCAFKFFAWQTLWIFCLTAVARAGELAQPTILGKFLEWFANPFKEDWEGYVWAATFFAIPFVSAMATNAAQQIAVRGVVQLRGALASMVYDKSIRISSTSNVALPERQSKKKAANDKKEAKENDKEDAEEKDDSKKKKKPALKAPETTTGKIVNLMSSDAEKVGLMMMMFPNSLITPVQVAVNLALIWDMMQAATLAGLGGMVICVPFMIMSLRWVAMYTQKQNLITDIRLKIINEILQGIRMVKFFAWEPSFLKRISTLRSQELKEIFRVTASFQLFTLIFNVIPVAVPLCTFSAYIYFYGQLNVIVIFKSLAYFQSIQIPLVVVPISLSAIGTGYVSARRLQTFLTMPELDPKLVQKDASDADYPLVVEGTYAYEKPVIPPALNAKKKGRKSVEAPPSVVEVKPFQLTDIRFRAQKGKLTAVIGSVGSGKSTLINSLLGEMRPVTDTAFKVVCAEDIGYVAQKAWIQSMTIRNNILFGRAFVEERYNAVIKACALDSDLQTLPHGDRTEIGDRGINLSGGQKQRIALARAVYSGAPAYMFDDPLSAVDANVGDHIMKKCFMGALAGTTRVLIMNQLHFLPHCDYIYVLEGGHIAAEGTFEVLNRENAQFQKLVKEHAEALASASAEAASPSGAGEAEEKKMAVTVTPPTTQRSSSVSVKLEDPDQPREEPQLATTPRPPSELGDSPLDHNEPPPAAAENHPLLAGEHPVAVGQLAASQAVLAVSSPLGPAAALLPIGVEILPEKQDKTQMEEEEINTGKIGSGGYLTHFRAMGWGYFCMYIFSAVVCQAGLSVGNFVLTWWTQDKFLRGRSMDANWWYLALLGLVGLATAAAVFTRGMLFSWATKVACGQYHSALIEKTMKAPSAFYDVTPVGRVLNRFSKDMNDIDAQLPRTMQGALNLAFMIIGSLISTAVVTPLFLSVMAVTGVLFYALQRYFSRSTIQLKRIESVSRSPVYNHFSETLLGLATIRAFKATERFKYTKIQRINQMTQSFFLLRCVLNWASLRVGMLNSFLMFFAVLFVVIAKGTLNPGDAAVAIYFVLGIGPMLGFMVMNLTELDNQMNAVERVNHYCKDLPQEASWDADQVEVPESWPSQGKIELKDVVFRYRKNLDPVLHGLTASINSVEKIGVAGRTGSGKSSLMLTLFRMYEIESGSIFVDGLDISKLGLHTLRRKLAIIPQDPVVFSGTVRDNLDPFSAYSDQEVWDALDQVQLGPLVRSIGGLLGAVKEYGENLSVGQRQLLCIARAVLKKPKILVMDEATSSVDSATDTLVQKMVRTTFKDATTITIAHRLNTIMDCDRVMVLAQGHLVEFDVPQTLVQNGGVFATMHHALTHTSN